MLDGRSLSASDKPILLRIVIIGEVMNLDTPTGKKAGAYVDVSLNPTELVQPTELIRYSTAEIINGSGGKIEGIITSADEAGKLLPNVIVSLEYHPAFNKYDLNKALATTRTDAQGKYAFDNVEPGIYALNTTVFLEQGGSCDIFDLTRIIKIEDDIVATVDFSLTCTP